MCPESCIVCSLHPLERPHASHGFCLCAIIVLACTSPHIHHSRHLSLPKLLGKLCICSHLRRSSICRLLMIPKWHGNLCSCLQQLISSDLRRLRLGKLRGKLLVEAQDVICRYHRLLKLPELSGSPVTVCSRACLHRPGRLACQSYLASCVAGGSISHPAAAFAQCSEATWQALYRAKLHFHQLQAALVAEVVR